MTQLAVTPRTESALVPAAVVAAVLATAAAAWLILVARMAGMNSGPGGDLGTLGWFAATWSVMTAAMMLPAAAPAVLRLVRASDSQTPAAAIVFLAGYGAVWILAGLAGYAVVEAFRSLHVHALAWSAAGRYVAGAAIVAAGVYQLSPVKLRWLRRCTDPDFGRRRSPGLAGILRAGVEHGRCCLACCWTLMAALYALGLMSIAWGVVITVLIVAERLRAGRALTRAVAVALIVLGVAVAAAPASVPGLTMPGMTMNKMAQRVSPPTATDDAAAAAAPVVVRA